MSLTAFKKKSVIIHGSKRSGTAPGGIWLPQGPFGKSLTGLQLAIDHPGPVGFSINGGHRNIGGVGREMRMSKSGTPYRGVHPVGFGGTYGKYPSATLVGFQGQGQGQDQGQFTGAIRPVGNTAPVVEPVLNSRIVNTMGTQYLYIKPSVLSTSGMLDKKYRWAKYGVYPNYWVQPNYTGNQTDTASQGQYLRDLASANVFSLNVNNAGQYEEDVVTCGPTLCKPGRSTAGFKYNDMARNAPYTKTLYQPVSYDQYNLYLTRKCNNPVGPQKPFPYRVQTGSGHSASGTSITNFGTGCGTSDVYLAPPEWYTELKPGEEKEFKDRPQNRPFLNTK